MNSLKINIDQIQNPEVKEIVRIIDEAVTSLGLDFYVIGARARDFWLDAHKIPPHRFTNDIDFAILVSDYADFDKIKQVLHDKYNCRIVAENPHRVVYQRSDLIIDLLPFGGVEQAGYISFRDKDSTKISVLGFSEVYQQIVEDGYADGDLKIASLPGLCILKLIAWADKPYERQKDIIDIATIIKHYFSIFETEIYEKHLDLFDDDFDKTHAGARVLGRHIQLITVRSQRLMSRINNILTDNIINMTHSPIGDNLAYIFNKPIDYSVDILKEIYIGLNE